MYESTKFLVIPGNNKVGYLISEVYDSTKSLVFPDIGSFGCLCYLVCFSLQKVDS